MAAASHLIVFGGPSLIHMHGGLLPGATLLPPIRRGDLPAAVEAQPAAVIAIIDGIFGQDLAVTVSEVRDALRRGWDVVGGASMGALRACECGPLGMRGAGWIHDLYRRRVLTSDAEVALVHDAVTFCSFTIPLVNVRWLLRGSGLVAVDDRMRDELLAVAAGVHYTQRSPARLRAAWGAVIGAHESAVLDHLEEGRLAAWDRKAMDAREVLQTAHALAEARAEIGVPT